MLVGLVVGFNLSTGAAVGFLGFVGGVGANDGFFAESTKCKHANKATTRATAVMNEGIDNVNALDRKTFGDATIEYVMD